MSERPKLHIVSTSEGVQSGKVDSRRELVTPSKLLEMWSERGLQMPKDFAESVTERLVNDARSSVKEWTSGQLYTYLANDGLWSKPSFTQAVMDEVLWRKDIRTFNEKD